MFYVMGFRNCICLHFCTYRFRFVGQADGTRPCHKKKSGTGRQGKQDRNGVERYAEKEPRLKETLKHIGLM